jgi:rubrerythrin
MKKISRRKFLYIVAALPFSHPLYIVSASSKENKPEKIEHFPITYAVLKAAYKSEKVASEHYVGYSRIAVKEKYPNIAYLFSSFAVSEKIHAANYKRILTALSSELKEPQFEILISDTKTNLTKTAESELQKIKNTYRDFLAKLKEESHDQAVISCMYAWKSHRQHRRQIKEIQKYSKQFFGAVAKKIEGMELDFHVCQVCGSTIAEAPKTPCDICNYPNSHYQKVIRPA